MKIITTSNYNLESYAQRVVATGIESESEAKVMLNALQENPNRSDSTWYAIVPDNYRLWRGMAEFANETCDVCGLVDGNCL